MDKTITFSVMFFLLALVTATVMSFGGIDAKLGGFGGENYDRKYQNWLDKRGLGQDAFGGFGRPLGSEHRYFNWKDYLANGITKRQLNYGPRSFGNFQRYFTNGLQDWRTTYTGIKKREAQPAVAPAAVEPAA